MIRGSNIPLGTDCSFTVREPLRRHSRARRLLATLQSELLDHEVTMHKRQREWNYVIAKRIT